MKSDNILDIKFRDKGLVGWKKYRSIIHHSSDAAVGAIVEPLDVNVFMKGFLRNLYLRPSCHNCPVKSFKSGADITIGDYWGIENILPEFDDDRGVSLVMVNTKKGKQIYDSLDTEYRDTTYAQALAGNPSIERPTAPSVKRAMFFESWHKEPLIPLIDRLTIDPIQVRLKKVIVFLLCKLKLLTFIKSLLKK